jgi:copper chaperone NosL
MKHRWLLSGLFLSLLVLVACGGGAAEAPPEIRYGEDVCDQCHMIISEPAFATAYVSEDGATRRFDDIGEMFLYIAESGEAVREAWVHDFDDESWLKTDEATYVHDPALMTPMGWGLAAFRSAEQAQAYQAQNGGALYSLTELQTTIEAGKIHPGTMTGAHNHGAHGHSHDDVIHTHSSHSHEEK